MYKVSENQDLKGGNEWMDLNPMVDSDFPTTIFMLYKAKW